jgi:hypothetical protein
LCSLRSNWHAIAATISAYLAGGLNGGGRSRAGRIP